MYYRIATQNYVKNLIQSKLSQMDVPAIKNDH